MAFVNFYWWLIIFLLDFKYEPSHQAGKLCQSVELWLPMPIQALENVGILLFFLSKLL
jgi:hypothetical protein